MKTPLIYGFSMGLATALVTLLLYFTGYHDSAEKLSAAQWIGGGVNIAILVACLALAMKEKRANSAPENDWGYGSALGVGVLTALAGAIFGAVFGYLYFGILNPGFGDVILDAQIAAMEAKGMPAATIERAEPMMRKWMSAPVMAIMGCVSSFILGTVLSLIVAIFFRRRDADVVAPPPVMA